MVDIMQGFFDIVIIGGSFGGIKSAWDLRNKLPRGGRSLQLCSQWMSDGDVEVVKASHQAELPKIKFEKLFVRHRGNIGELHRKMIKQACWLPD
jgi:dihydroorotate dehydrogenase